MTKKVLNIEEWLFKLLMKLSTIFIIFALLSIIVSIFYRGLPVLSWEMISQSPKGGFYFGKEGGILNAIVGSLYLAIISTLLAAAIGIPVALYINVYMTRHAKIAGFIRFCLDLLWGVPSIVYGAFGFTVMILLGLKTSLLAGIITVTIFILPIMVRSLDEILSTVPRGLHEASLSLGSTRSETAFRVFLRQCTGGIITGVLLAFGRGIGDAASVLFTAGYTDFIPNSLFRPAATLPLAIFFQLGSPFPEVQDRAYAATVVLTIIILIISITTRIITRKYRKNQIGF